MTELTDKQQALLDELLKDFKGDARDLFGEGGLLKTIGKRALEAALEGELTHHLGYPPHDRSGRKSGNSRNGRMRSGSRASRVRWIWRFLAIATAVSSPGS